MAKSLREINADRLGFNPLGTHSSGATINVALVLTIPAGAGKVMMQALTQNVRYTLDGTTPTATLGYQLKAADPPVILALGPRTVITVIEELATASLQYQFGE